MICALLGLIMIDLSMLNLLLQSLAYPIAELVIEAAFPGVVGQFESSA
jgi:hypothetical protein